MTRELGTLKKLEPRKIKQLPSSAQCIGTTRTEWQETAREDALRGG
jgi:hypothetical protein